MDINKKKQPSYFSLLKAHLQVTFKETVLRLATFFSFLIGTLVFVTQKAPLAYAGGVLVVISLIATIYITIRYWRKPIEKDILGEPLEKK